MRPSRLKVAGVCADRKRMDRPPTTTDVSGLTRRLERRAAEARPRINPQARAAAAAQARIPLDARVSAAGKNPATRKDRSPMTPSGQSDRIRRDAESQSLRGFLDHGAPNADQPYADGSGGRRRLERTPLRAASAPACRCGGHGHRFGVPCAVCAPAERVGR